MEYATDGLVYNGHDHYGVLQHCNHVVEAGKEILT